MDTTHDGELTGPYLEMVGSTATGQKVVNRYYGLEGVEFSVVQEDGGRLRLKIDGNILTVESEEEHALWHTADHVKGNYWRVRVSAEEKDELGK